MTGLDLTKPVALVSYPRQTGRVVGAEIGGYVFVRWDTGGGNNIAVDRLIQAERDRRMNEDDLCECPRFPDDPHRHRRDVAGGCPPRPPEDKSWPPRDMETK